MPVPRFFWMRQMVSRLRADDILKLSNLAMLALGGDDKSELLDSLVETAGSDFEIDDITSADPVINPETGLDVNFDKAGLRELKALSSAF